MFNSVVCNTIAQQILEKRQAQQAPAEDDMYMVYLSSTTLPDAGEECAPVFMSVQHDSQMPHVVTEFDYDEFNESDAKVSVEVDALKADIEHVVQRYADRFPVDIPTGLPPHRAGISHAIPLKPGEQNPPSRKPFRLTPAEKTEVEEKLRDLLEKGWIRPSHSPYGAPVLFVKKKDGGLRMCVDYRPLNKQTVKNKYPIPRIDDTLDCLQGAKFFSSLDLQQAYHQVRLKEEDIEKTAFITHKGQYEYRVLCFGLTNAPATFQALMNRVLQPYLGKSCLVYMDDVLVYSKTAAEHVQHLKEVLQCFRDNQLYCKLSKSHFAMKEVSFLGQVVGRDGIKPNPAKVQVLLEWPAPTNVHDLRCFLGLAQYFSKFIPGYASMTTCLQALLRKNAIWQWTDTCENAFQDVKSAMMHPPVLALPDDNLQFEVVTDACITGVGAVLLQQGRPIAFIGRRLLPAETRYTTTDQELLAVIFALQQWRCYLQGAKHDFLLVTDHHPNTYLATMPTLSRRQARWSEKLQEYSFEWQYQPGKRNIADPVSRSLHLPAPSEEILAQLSLLTQELDFDCAARPDSMYAGLAHAVTVHAAAVRVIINQDGRAEPESCILSAMTRGQIQKGKQLQQQQANQQGVAARKESLVRDDSPHPASTVASRPAGQLRPVASSRSNVAPQQSSTPVIRPAVFGPHDAVTLSWIPELRTAYLADPLMGDPDDPAIRHQHMKAKNGLWYRDTVIAVPNCPSIKREIMTELHDSQYAGHGGELRTVQLIRRYFWWPSLGNDCRQFVKGCALCQRNKASTQKYGGLLQPHSLAEQKWDKVSMDFVTGLPLTARGHDMIMVVVDQISKMAHFIPCNVHCTAREIASLFMQNVFKLHGWPKTFITDRDTKFKEAFFTAVAAQMGTTQVYGSAYHHETSGQVERMNRLLEETLRHYVNKQLDNWDELLPCAEFAINNSFQQSIMTTPFQLNYGYHPTVPLDVGICPHDAANTFVRKMQTVMHATGRYHAFAQQRLNADEISAAVGIAKQHLEAAQNRQKQYADRHRRPVSFQPGDQVMLKTKNFRMHEWPGKKLLPLWVGPFEVERAESKVSYQLVIPQHWRIHNIFHVNLLKPFRDNGQPHAPPPFTLIAGQPFEYEVDCILAHHPASTRLEHGMKNKQLKQLSFLVQWKYCAAEDSTWEPYENLKHAPESLANYWQRMTVA